MRWSEGAGGGQAISDRRGHAGSYCGGGVSNLARSSSAAGGAATHTPEAPRVSQGVSAGISPALAIFLSLFVFMAAIGFIRGANHDEGQYVAAVAMMRHGLPFIDFDYLQTPLQPLLFTPLAWLPPAYLFAALRLVNAALVAGAAVVTFWAIVRQGRSGRAALAAAGFLGLSELGVFAGMFARNDALPLLLYVCAICAFLEGMKQVRPAAWFGAAGLFLGAAISAKICYAVPAAAFGVVALGLDRQLRVRAVLAMAAGGAAGLLPTLLLYLQAPDAFYFGVFEYSLRAPQQWRLLNGEAHLLMPGTKLFQMVRILATGAGLPILIWAAVDASRRRAGPRSREILLLDLLIATGLVAAYLPDPTYKQYLIPVLPPLVLRLGLCWDRIAPRTRRTLMLCSTLGILIGLVPSGRDALRAGQSGSPMTAAIADAREVRALAGMGPVATLSPERIAGSGIELDSRFVTGPFLFRTRDLLTSGPGKAMRGVQAQSLRASLDRLPPAAMLIGGQARPFALFPEGMDAELLGWATANGYRRHQLPSGAYALLVRP